MSKKFHILYKITNTLNGKIYIGSHSTNNPNDSYMGSSKYLNQDIKKFGLENFTKEILSYYNSTEDLALAEAEVVNKDFVKRNDTYNVQIGGCGKWTRSDETKELLSKNAKILMANRAPSVMRKNSEAMVKAIKNISPERRAEWNKNLSKALKGNPVRIEATKKSWENAETRRSRCKGISIAKKEYYKNNPMPKAACPHCGLECTHVNFVRWHGDNCKHKEAAK